MERGARYVKGWTVLVIPNDKPVSREIAEGLYEFNPAKKSPWPLVLITGLQGTSGQVWQNQYTYFCANTMEEFAQK